MSDSAPDNRSKRSIRVGTVVSDKMDKSISVVLDTLVKHPIVKKYIKRRTRCMAHDEKNEARIGDKVKIIESRPMSKKKRWSLESVLKRNVQIEK